MEAVRHVSLYSLFAMAEDASKLTNAKLRTVQRFIYHYFGVVHGQLIVDLNVTGLSNHYANVIRKGYVSRHPTAQATLDRAGIQISLPKLVTLGEHEGVAQRVLRFELDIQYAHLDTLKQRDTFLSMFSALMEVLPPPVQGIRSREERELYELYDIPRAKFDAAFEDSSLVNLFKNALAA